MIYDLKPMQQETEFGCLATCCAMIKNYFFGDVFDKEKETEKTSKAFSFETKFNEHFHLKELHDRGCEIKVYVEIPYMQEGYEQLNSKLGCNIPINLKVIGVKDYKKLLKEGYILITLIDRWNIDMILHNSHYVIVNGYDEDNLYVIDPLYKLKISFADERFLENIRSLKNKLGYSPLIFAVRK